MKKKRKERQSLFQTQSAERKWKEFVMQQKIIILFNRSFRQSGPKNGHQGRAALWVISFRPVFASHPNCTLEPCLQRVNEEDKNVSKNLNDQTILHQKAHNFVSKSSTYWLPLSWFGLASSPNRYQFEPSSLPPCPGSLWATFPPHQWYILASRSPASSWKKYYLELARTSPILLEYIRALGKVTSLPQAISRSYLLAEYLRPCTPGRTEENLHPLYRSGPTPDNVFMKFNIYLDVWKLAGNID